MFVSNHRRSVSLTQASSPSLPPSSDLSPHHHRTHEHGHGQKHFTNRNNRSPTRQEDRPSFVRDISSSTTFHISSNSVLGSSHSENMNGHNGNADANSSLHAPASPTYASSSFVINVRGDDGDNGNGGGGGGGGGSNGLYRQVLAVQNAWKCLGRTKQNAILVGIGAMFLFLVWYGFSKSNAGGWSSTGLMPTSNSLLQSPPMLKYNAASESYDIVLVSDRDSFSYDANRKVWVSSLLQGKLQRYVEPTSGKIRYRFSMDKEKQRELKGVLVEKTRGMELSELQWFGNKLYTADDRTGIVYEVVMDSSKKNSPYAIQRYILPDGDGQSSTKGFKCEWMTVKDGNLIVGSMGKEWTDGKTGAVISDAPMWIKLISHQQTVRHKSFSYEYERLMEAAVGAENRKKGGYLLHEAVSWNDHHNRWFFLPRRISKDPYDEDADVYRGANILISADERFKDIRVVDIQQDTMNSRGFSTFKFVPHRPNEIIAIKSEEIGEKMQSFITVITVDGQVLLPETAIALEKIEGVEFL